MGSEPDPHDRRFLCLFKGKRKLDSRPVVTASDVMLNGRHCSVPYRL